MKGFDTNLVHILLPHHVINSAHLLFYVPVASFSRLHLCKYDYTNGIQNTKLTEKKKTQKGN